MSVSSPFTPLGNTVTISTTTSASSPTQVPSVTLGANQYRVINAGGNVAFLAIAQTSAQATINAGNVATMLPLLPGTDEILSFLPNAYFSANTSSGSGTIYITPGDGD
jgi:uncharacterized protein with beta-barrel porin domain